MKTVQIIAFTVFAFNCQAKTLHLSDEFIKSINTNQKTWTAGRNFPEDTPPEDLKRLVGTLQDPNIDTTPKKIHDVIPDDIPDTFDGRTFWPQCESLNDIRNQGNCGSCWAFGAVEAITDRTCISSNGRTKIKFSPEDLLTCCSSCGSCSGGFVGQAWTYWVENGLVSGGDYNSNEGCQPYQEDPFENGVTPGCSTTCLNTDYNTSYVDDKYYGGDHYMLALPKVDQIQTEIWQNGPVEVTYTVYEDFYSYKSGVYVHTSGATVGLHAVKIIGWGIDNGTQYWLVANSWGTTWGDLGGFFKILRGEDHCGIERWVYGGMPKL